MIALQFSDTKVCLSHINDSVACPAGHEKCPRFGQILPSIFKKIKLGSLDKISYPKSKSHRIIFLIEGGLSISASYNHKYDMVSAHCIFLEKGSESVLTAVKPSVIYELETAGRMFFCERDILLTLAKQTHTQAEPSPVLPMVDEVYSFLQGLRLSNPGMNKPCYHLLKAYELAMTMWYNYPAHELGSFFRRALSPRDDFKSFVLSSYSNVSSFSDFARMANMSQSTFRRVFVGCFGQTYQSWRTQRKASDMVSTIKKGITSNSELMRIFDFKSYPLFYRFCVRNLGESPSSLKKKYSSES